MFAQALAPPTVLGFCPNSSGKQSVEGFLPPDQLQFSKSIGRVDGGYVLGQPAVTLRC